MQSVAAERKNLKCFHLPDDIFLERRKSHDDTKIHAWVEQIGNSPSPVNVFILRGDFHAIDHQPDEINEVIPRVYTTPWTSWLVHCRLVRASHSLDQFIDLDLGH